MQHRLSEDNDDDAVMERLPWGAWRCIDEAVPIYSCEYETVSQLKEVPSSREISGPRGRRCYDGAPLTSTTVATALPSDGRLVLFDFGLAKLSLGRRELPPASRRAR